MYYQIRGHCYIWHKRQGLEIWQLFRLVFSTPNVFMKVNHCRMSPPSCWLDRSGIHPLRKSQGPIPFWWAYVVAVTNRSQNGRSHIVSVKYLCLWQSSAVAECVDPGLGLKPWGASQFLDEGLGLDTQMSWSRLWYGDCSYPCAGPQRHRSNCERVCVCTAVCMCGFVSHDLTLWLRLVATEQHERLY